MTSDDCDKRIVKFIYFMVEFVQVWMWQAFLKKKKKWINNNVEHIIYLKSDIMTVNTRLPCS